MGTQESKVYIVLLIVAAVIAVIFIYFTIIIFRQQKRNFSSYLSKVQAEIITLEKERLRFARDMHDDFAPLLVSVKYNIDSVESQRKEDAATLSETGELLDNMIDRLREVSNNLVPVALEQKGLVKIVERLIANDRSGIDIRFKHDGSVSDLPHDNALHIFRIIQEILHNSIKHSKAKNLAIELKTDKNNLVLLTEDNGVGFDYQLQQRDYTGLGLRSLLSRADVLNGKMFLDSMPGKGTRYFFEFPL
ncbi:MAG: ATP-binding protein [Chitinophagaceae bacterium]